MIELTLIQTLGIFFVGVFLGVIIGIQFCMLLDLWG